MAVLELLAVTARSSLRRAAVVGKPSGIASASVSELTSTCSTDVIRIAPITRDVASLTGAHHAVFPQPDGLGLGAVADGIEEFTLEEEHG